MIAIIMFAVAGIALGGAYSVRKQKGDRKLSSILLFLGVIAAAAGVLWAIPDGS